MIKYFRSSLWITFICFVALALWFAFSTGQWQMGLQGLFIAFVLAILEVSLSFDNAIVNATVLKEMTPIWRQRFLTWGILIAVFGMRLIFPVALVSIVGGIDPLSALRLAFFEPVAYAKMMTDMHEEISAFGGTFLLMVCLKYFYDTKKDKHWWRALEMRLSRLGHIEAIEIGITLLVLLGLTHYIVAAKQFSFLTSGLAGLITYLAVGGVSSLLESHEVGGTVDVHRASIGMFLYLEVLDASFSFDGVIGAFAITNDIITIMVGLGVGAFFVRSLTIYFVEEGTLDQFAFLEHGAFYAIGLLALLMLFSPFLHIPEWITGLSGAAIIGVSVVSSIRHQKAMTKS